MFFVEDVYSRLSRLSFFKHLPNNELKEIAQYFSYKKVTKNKYIFRQGDTFQSIYFLCEGQVKIIRADRHGREQLVAVCYDQEMFPHLGFYFRNSEYPASTFVSEDAQLLYLPSQNIERLLTNHPTVSLIFLNVMGEKMIDLQHRLEEKILSSTYEQVIKLLLRLANKHSVKLSNGNLMLVIPFQNKELASMIGATRETVSRIMNKLAVSGMIERDHKGRLIIKVKELNEEL